MATGTKDYADRALLAVWWAAMLGFTIVAITTYYDNENHIKKLEAELPQTWPEEAWECRRPVNGVNIQTLFKGEVLQQSAAAKDRDAFNPNLRTACHHCRAEGNKRNGHELLIPAGANATAGLSASVLGIRSGILTLGGFFNNANLGDARAARCSATDGGSFYLVWDDAGSTLQTCYCRLGVESCGDPMLTSGAPALNCVGGGPTLPVSFSTIAKDCSSCAPGDQLC